jgi:deoxyribonuclease-4
MAEVACSIGANTFQFFSRNPRGGNSASISEDDIGNFLKFSSKNKFSNIVAHAPYTMNLCSAKESIRKFSFNILKNDIMRLASIPGIYYNFHPGSHTGQGVETGIKMITDALNACDLGSFPLFILIETMAGKGSEIGSNFEEIRKIIEGVHSDNIGVCFDVCHVNDAGYDVVENFESTLERFDKVLGIEKLKVVHLNDSKNKCGSKKDRHEKIGKGSIGVNAIEKIVNNKILRGIPFILETPNDLVGYGEEISLIKNMLRS